MLASASLSFVLEPLFARMVLPLFGGAPAVWNTCVVFYQLALLGGYLYAHGITRWLRPKAQVISQLLLMLAAFAVLPMRPNLGWMPAVGSAVVPGILLMLTVSIGLPFFAVSTIAPLLQRWFAGTGHKDAADPYFLYAASNLGSFGGLLAYPILIEPNLRVSTQGIVWTGAYSFLILLVGLCGVRVWRASAGKSSGADGVLQAGPQDAVALDDASVGSSQRLRWVLLAAVPASLMLSVTTYASTDIAAVPLLWIVPLGLYLLTFVASFSRRQVLPAWLSGAILPLLVVPCVFLLVTELRQPVAFVLPLHIAAFFVAAMVCHGQLAQSRPGVSRLTEFYVWIAVGGAVGGLFNVLAAPILFVKTTEYPLVLLLACLLRPTPEVGLQSRTRWLPDLLLATVPGLVFAALVFSARFAGLPSTLISQILVVSTPLLICLGFWPWPRRFALGLVGIFVVAVYGAAGDPVLFAQRTFFGSFQVVESYGMHVLMHGTTNHGAQWIDPSRRYEPTTYYGRTGPIGQVFEQVRDVARANRIGVIGLGSASLSAYALPGERWTFYEIDPAIERIARDERLFTMLKRVGDQARVVLGDGRLSLRASTEQYDFLLLEAFTSDAIPVHLITREAVALYLAHLAPHGVLAFHISNRYLDLAPVLANLAAADGLTALVRGQGFGDLSAEERQEGFLASRWVVLARTASDLAPLTQDQRWQPLTGTAAAAWTDDFSNIWRVFHW
jgi:hypothetical protein